MKAEQEICPVCDGNGYVIDIEIEAECCRWADENGDCCNNPIAVQRQIQRLCSFCYEGIKQ